MNKNIVLVGLSGSGKSTIGKILKEKNNYQLIDTDEKIEKMENRTINDIFAEDGEEFFRNLETKISKDLQNVNSSIISTGGGIVLRQENIGYLKTNGMIFYLKTSPEVLVKRLSGDSTRPLLKTDDVKKKLENMLEIRGKLYEKADFIIETDNLSVNETVQEIMRLYNDRSKC